MKFLKKLVSDFFSNVRRKEKGYDAGKKISGIKRHILLDILPHVVSLTKTNVQDRK